MKKIVFILLIAFGLNISAQEKVNWVSFEKAVELNKNNPKPFLIDIYTDWCGWCKKMDRDTYANPVIADYINKNYHAVKMDGEGSEPITYKDYTFKLQQQGRTKYHELTAALMNGKLSYPTTVILNKEEKLLDRIPGYLDARKMEMVLAYFTRKERKPKKWADFVKNFKSNIKE
jgi:thioredoxin-related protein